MEILYQGPKSFYFRNAAVDVLIIEHFNAMGGESCVEVVLSDTIQHGKEYPRIYMNPRLILDRLNDMELSDRIDQMKRPFGNDLTKQGHKQIVRAAQVQMMSSFIINHLAVDVEIAGRRKIVSVVLRDSEAGSGADSSTKSIDPSVNGGGSSDKSIVPVTVAKLDKLKPFDISKINNTPQWRDHHLILDSKLQNSCMSFPSPTAASIASRNEHRLAHKEGGEAEPERGNGNLINEKKQSNHVCEQYINASPPRLLESLPNLSGDTAGNYQHNHHNHHNRHNHHHHQQQHADHLPPLTTSDSKRDVLHNHHHHHHHHHSCFYSCY
mmetsp:Transcript_27410/g.45982  ORF Transcript_27410/g.45982 Transcript_27410/m.45982 type:complete len:324 (-) Transcript_27410:160-1131(-)